jgi:hypothetical protein
MKLTILILLLFAKSCQSQEVEQKTTEINNKVIVEYTEPIKGFNVKIYWTIKDSISDIDNRMVGTAILELERQNDKTKFNVTYQSYSISDSICSIKVYEDFKKSDIPNIIQTNYSAEGRPDFYFKDINFDNVEELIITETGLEEYNAPVYRVFEFQNNELIELKDFPSISLHEGKGNIDYEKKEITTKDYYSCCEYDEDFYKYEKNSKEQFVYFKSIHHKIDPTTENEELIIKEIGKADVKIFKKK